MDAGRPGGHLIQRQQRHHVWVEKLLPPRSSKNARCGYSGWDVIPVRWACSVDLWRWEDVCLRWRGAARGGFKSGGVLEQGNRVPTLQKLLPRRSLRTYGEKSVDLSRTGRAFCSFSLDHWSDTLWKHLIILFFVDWKGLGQSEEGSSGQEAWRSTPSTGDCRKGQIPEASRRWVSLFLLQKFEFFNC